ncbi:MAG: peptidase T [Desulfobacterales bacterium]
MGLPAPVMTFLREDALERFLNYVRIDTRSDPNSGVHPSSPGQIELARLLLKELGAEGIQDAELDHFGYLYAVIPARHADTNVAITFCAHLDTSPAVSGQGVTPVLHRQYDGGIIRFPRDPELLLGPADSPELLRFKGDTIITASGDTLLGADDKAGVAAIMSAAAALHRFPELPCPELRIVLTPDEEIGQGADHIELERLGRFGYTVDGGEMGEIESECFHAEEVKLTFTGHNVHPGYAKNRLVNASAAAARLMAALPDADSPEHTEGREGFIHLTGISGNESNATLSFILRDFESDRVEQRRRLIAHLVDVFRVREPGLAIEMQVREQYRNMREVLIGHPEVARRAAGAIEMSGVPPIERSIRGGTDGARLSFMGMPTPNLFAGGMLFHSKKEWIPATALRKCPETLLHLCHLWAGLDSVST